MNNNENDLRTPEAVEALFNGEPFPEHIQAMIDEEARQIAHEKQNTPTRKTLKQYQEQATYILRMGHSLTAETHEAQTKIMAILDNLDHLNDIEFETFQ